VADFSPTTRRRITKEEPTVRIVLLAAAIGGLTALTASGVLAAPVAGAAGQYATAPLHVVQADWYWNHHHWHHRRWYHGHWHYWD
jgi:hypothetical protein